MWKKGVDAEVEALEAELERLMVGVERGDEGALSGVIRTRRLLAEVN